MSRDNPEFHLAIDVGGQVHLDRIEAEFLERPFDPDVVGLEGEALAPECFGDLVGRDRAVKMTFCVGVGLDRHRSLSDLGSQVQQVGAACFFEILQTLAMFLNHPQVVLGGEGCQPLRNEIIARIQGGP